MHMESTLGGTSFNPQGHLPPASPGETSRGNGIEPIDSNHLHGHVASIIAENRELRAELNSLRAERARVTEILTRLVEVLGSKSPDRLVHDVRNVLNERELYRALADSHM